MALAISNEDEDNRIYRSFADGLRGSYPETAAMYDKMAEEEIGHRDMLLELYRQKFGEFLPLIRRQDVKGFRQAPPDLAEPPARARRGAQVRRGDGIRDRALLPKRRETRADDDAVRDLLAQARRGRGQARDACAGARRKARAERARGGGRDRAPHVRAAIRAARPRRADGRLGLDARAAVCRGLCHPQYLGDVSGRARGLDRRRHLDGICRGAVRRRLAHRPRRAAGSRRRLRR